MSRDKLESVIKDFSIDGFKRFFRDKMQNFKPAAEGVNFRSERFENGLILGSTDFSDGSSLLVCSFKSSDSLSEISSKKAQYDISKNILKDQAADAGIFIFYDEAGNFRFSLVYTNYLGKKRDWSLYKRFTYYVTKNKKNKTFLNQIGAKEFSSLEKIKAAFSLSEVTKEFYDSFYPIFQEVASSVKADTGSVTQNEKEDFALLFVIRTIFIGFIQKRKWIGNDEEFLENFISEYKHSGKKEELYKKWIRPLFFEALNSEPGRKVAPNNNDFAPETEAKLQMAPYLNGGLFSEDKEIDRKGYYIPDAQIKAFFDFLFQYNFTIEENTLYDEELELNPEFLGIIFERLVNKADGAVYTPRTEVDMMCRLSLVKWILKNNKTGIEARDLYELFFPEAEKGPENQKHGSFSTKQYEEIISLLEKVTVCDPAVGSGAFPVGMMQVIDEIEEHIYKDRLNKEVPCAFDRKKRIISQSLYGVEVKEWAVWIAQLRLWISLFIEAPEDMKNSLDPILPSLDFKIRQGDSLVQMIGSKVFPVSGHADIKPEIKRKVTLLKKDKADFYYNCKGCLKKEQIKKKELDIFKEILDDEIENHKTAIKALLSADSKSEMKSLFTGETVEAKVKKSKTDTKELDFHNNEIEELNSQRKSLSENKPLIWSIEFSEIFVENGGFDIVIGNPPYVRQEDISDPLGKIEDKKRYKDLLAEMVRIDFPEHFIKDRKINAQSDLYTYFYIRSLKLLNEKGIHTFICSNSWLDVGYGAWLQEFLLNNAPIDFIIDNHAKRSFEAADINTIISIINAPVKPKKLNENHHVKFIAYKKPFEEALYTENLLNIELTNNITKNDFYRVYPITIKELKLSGTEFENEEDEKLGVGKYEGDKWGSKFLKINDLVISLLTSNKLTILGKIANIDTISWSRKGLNKTIIISKTEKKKRGYVDLFKSPRDVEKIRVDDSDTSFYLNSVGIEDDIKFAPLLWGDLHDKKHICYYCTTKTAFSHAFHGITPKDSEKAHALCSILNCTITWLITEVFGRSSLGGGALRVLVEEMRKTYPVVSLEFFHDLSKLERALDNISGRKINDVFEECGIDPFSEIPIEEQVPIPLPDRKELDDIVFDALELTQDERKEVYRAVCRLVWNRISKAKSVKKR